MIDSHCHLDLPAFDEDRDKVLSKALQLGIRKIHVPGLKLAQCERLLDFKRQYPAIDIGFGLHPCFLDTKALQNYNKLLDTFTHLAYQHKASYVAISECGIDASIDFDLSTQEQVFRHQIELALTLKKPVVVHHRQSHNQIIRILKNCRFDQGGVIHAFSGSQEIAKSYIDMGFCLGVGGIITYPRASKTRETIRLTSLQYLLLETDSPDMPINGYQGQRNSPSRLPIVARCLADLQGLELEHIIDHTTENYTRLFAR